MKGDDLSFDELVSALRRKGKHALARGLAKVSGWNDEEYYTRYRRFLESAIIADNTEDEASTKEKGEALEELVRYFLEAGGIATEVIELKLDGFWQIDGYGLVNREAVKEVFGRDAERVGVELLAEAKNHKDPVGAAEFAAHVDRMEMAGCSLGVLFSRAGFAVSGGQGIAYKAHIRSYADKQHNVLISSWEFADALDLAVPPLAILVRAFARTKNNQYVESSVAAKHGKSHCLAWLDEQQQALVDEELSES